MYELPTEIIIENVPYRIRNKGDFRTILDIFSILEDESIPKSEKIISALIIFYEDLQDIEDLDNLPNIEEATRKMYEFFECGRTGEGRQVQRKLIDWEVDEPIITAAINSMLGKEIRLEEYVHWWTFIGYFMSIGESTLSTVVSIRNKSAKGEKLEKWERKFKAENPQYFNVDLRSIQEKEDDAWFNDLVADWNKE